MPKEISVKRFECVFCQARYKGEEACKLHEDNYCFKNTSINWKWGVVKKSYRNAEQLYCFQTCIPKDKWDEGLLYYIGCHTVGGHNYGWKVEIVSIGKYNPMLVDARDIKYCILPPDLRVII